MYKSIPYFELLTHGNGSVSFLFFFSKVMGESPPDTIPVICLMTGENHNDSSLKNKH